ncbi:MAG: ThiF family adenylyltransferase, partial [Collinsella sp.]|nr:ThiF family adenylyltransferase [Collinsella sp.]
MTETAAAAPVETRDTKLEIIMGREALNKLANATVLVLGCGGVGSNCCEALARGGIGHFVILDK